MKTKLTKTNPFFTNRAAIALLVTCSQAVLSQSTEIKLWDKIPGAIEDASYKEINRTDEKGRVTGFSKVSEPSLKIYLADPKNGNTAGLIICPGGGYANLSAEKEGNKVAKWLQSIGVSAFVLKYRLPSDAIMKDKSIGPLQDAQQAVRTLRKNAGKWNLDPSKIGFMGFSAGGHLAATLATHYDATVYEPSEPISARPDFSILIYPVISMENSIAHKGSRENLLGKNPTEDLVNKFSNEKQVNASTPMTFLVHASDDKAVVVENSIAYYLALKHNKVPAELHLYQNGGHGFGLGLSETHKNWPTACEKWLEANGFTQKADTYLFAYFKGNGEDGLHLASSSDGYQWTALKKDHSFLTPEVGKDKLMRDPCIIKGEDDLYHMVWTIGWTDKGIGYAHSKDLIHWSKQEYIPVMTHEEKTRNSWAPEITYDQKTKNYMIYWASSIIGKFPETQSKEESGYNHRIYYTTTKDFKKFKATKLLYDPGFNCIDASIVKQGSGYTMYLKDETKDPVQKNIKIAYSKKLQGPYGKASDPISGNYWAEGPTHLAVNDQRIIYFDKYTQKKYGALKQIPEGWEDISEQISFPEGIRHGTAIKVPAELISNLKKQ